MTPQFLQPPVDVLVGLVLADIVDEKRADGTAVVGRSDGSVSLLSGGIPNLGLDGLGVHLDRPRSKFYTNSGLGIQVELIAGETTQQVGLSDTRVADQHDCCCTQCQYVVSLAFISVYDAVGRSSRRGGKSRGQAPLKRNYEMVGGG